jgi:hypothetical protein
MRPQTPLHGGELAELWIGGMHATLPYAPIYTLIINRI